MIKQRQQGFTLVELMVVVAIIGILAAFALSNYQKYIEKTNLAAAKTVLADIASEMKQNKVKNSNKYSSTGLEDLIQSKTKESADVARKYKFEYKLDNNDINKFYVYVTPKDKSFTKSAYITAGGKVFECSTKDGAASKASSCK